MKPSPRPNVSPALLLVLQVGLSSVAYFFAQALAFKFPDSFGLLAAFWPASGIALAALLLNPRRRWPALLGCLFVAGLAANLTTDRPFITSVGFMVANICETAGSAWLLTRLCGPSIRFTRVSQVRALAGAALLINASTSLIGAEVAYLTLGRGFWSFYRSWFVVDGLGILLVTPLIVVWAAPWRPLAGRSWKRSIELWSLVALSCGVTWFAFGRESVTAFVEIRPYMLLIFVVWAALRAGSRGMATLLGMMAIIAIVCTAANSGSFPLGGADTSTRLFAVQLFLGVMGVTGLLLTAAITQKREDGALLQSVADGTSDAIYVKDRQGRYLFMNAAAARFVGKPAAEVIGRDDLAFFSAAEVATLQAEDRVTLESPVVRIYEKRLTDEAGVERILYATTGPLRGADGQVMGVFGIARDISAQKQAESSIQEISERQQAILQTAMDGFWMVDAQGRVLMVNETYCRMSGYTKAELLTMSVSDLEVIESKAEVLARVQKIMAQGEDRFESRHRRKDGSVFDVEVSAQHQPSDGGRVVVFMHDITERKQKERVLQESEARYRNLFEHMVEGVAYCQIIEKDGQPWDWIYLSVNSAFEPLTGLKNVIGRRATEVIPGLREKDPELLTFYGRVARTGQHEQQEVFVAALQEWFAVSVYSSNPGYFVAVFDVITKRKLADVALRESENRFALLFGHLVVGFALHEIICDSDGNPCDYRFLAVNPAFEKLTGQSSQALIGRTVKEVWPETETEWIQRYGAVALGGGPIHFDLFFKALGRQYEVSAYSPAPRQFATIITDITDRIHAEAELRLQGGALRAAANAIVITDRQGNIVWANPSFTRLTGYAVREVLGKNPRVLKSGEHAADFYRQLWETINAGQVWSSELVNKRKDGSLYTEEMTITPVRDDHSEITHFIAVKQDITARKQVEHALQASNRQLLEAAAELGAVQRQVIQQASLRALGQMASGMAHDFNNALSPIIGFSELLLRHRDKLADLEQAAKFLKLINIAGHDAADVVRRLREFGRQRGDGVVSDAINLVGLIRQTIELTQPRWKDQAQANGITIQMVTDLGKVPLFAGEEFAIRELLTNLIFNAVDALPTGGKITLGSAVDGNFVRLWVSDNGTGMTEEVRQRCFEPFYTTKEDKGSGLGLSMVHGIVQRHGGTVEIASELGRGTTFTIRLPVQEPRVASGPGTESALNRKLRVLVVDDEPVLCAIVREWLTADGHTVVTAGNGAAALVQVQAGPRFELVITDKAMPNMNGEQLAVALTAIDPNLPIILMTGFGDLMKASGELPPHIRAILSKPIMEASLREVLAKVFLG